MGNKIDVLITCKDGKHRFQVTFEEKEPLKWHGVAVKSLAPLSFVERMMLKKERSDGGGALSLFKRPQQQSSMANVKGEFFMDQIRCPTCGSDGFVKCGKCGELTCHVYGESYFKCASCDNEGTVSGTIDNLSGNTSKGGDRAPTVTRNNNGPKYSLK